MQSICSKMHVPQIYKNWELVQNIKQLCSFLVSINFVQYVFSFSAFFFALWLYWKIVTNNSFGIVLKD